MLPISLTRISHELSARPALKAGCLGLIGVAAIYVSIVSVAGLSGILGACLAIVVLTIAAIDFRSFIIPNWLNAAGLALALLHAAVVQPEDILWAIVTAVCRGSALTLVFLGIRLLYSRTRGRDGLGLGDVKLAAVCGAWLDWTFIPIALQLAVFTALCGYLLRQFIVGRSISRTDRVPFGVFFAPAIWFCWLLQGIWPEAF